MERLARKIAGEMRKKDVNENTENTSRMIMRDADKVERKRESTHMVVNNTHHWL